MRFVAGRRVSDLPEVMAPGSEIAVLERRKVPASARRQRKADCAKWRSAPFVLILRELGKPKARGTKTKAVAVERSDAQKARVRERFRLKTP